MTTNTKAFLAEHPVAIQKFQGRRLGPRRYRTTFDGVVVEHRTLKACLERHQAIVDQLPENGALIAVWIDCPKIQSLTVR